MYEKDGATIEMWQRYLGKLKLEEINYEKRTYIRYDL